MSRSRSILSNPHDNSHIFVLNHQGSGHGLQEGFGVKGGRYRSMDLKCLRMESVQGLVPGYLSLPEILFQEAVLGGTDNLESYFVKDAGVGRCHF